MSENTAMVVIVFFQSLVAIAAIAGAVYLAYHGKAGWGWLLFVAVATGVSRVRLGV